MIDGNSPVSKNSCLGQCCLLSYKMGQYLHFDPDLCDADCMVECNPCKLSVIKFENKVKGQKMTK